MEHEGDAMVIPRRAKSMLGFLAGLLVLSGMLLFVRNAYMLTSPARRHLSRSASGPEPLVALAAADEVSLVGAGRLYQLSTAAVVTCTLEITTTDKAPLNNLTLDTAASIANYTDQSLLVGVGPYDAGASVSTRSDFYRLDNALPGYKYTVQAKPDRTINYNLGMIVYNNAKVAIITDTNTFDNNFASVTVPADSYGPYYFEVFQISDQCSGGTYSLILGSTAPTSTPSPTATSAPSATATPVSPTWMTGFDQYEPNYDFGVATTIAPGLSYNMNFVPWGGADVDNDFLKVRVKPGLQLTCETSDLDPAVDPRMAFYTGPGEQYYVMANDDISLGDFNSRLSYYVNYEGFLYILIGQGTRMARRDTVNSAYTVACQLTVPGQTTVPGQPTPISKAPIPTYAPTPTPRTSPIATPTPPPAQEDVSLTFRLVTRPEVPTATPEPNGFRTFRVLVYFDADLDGQMGAGEGVTGFYVLAYSPDGHTELAQGYTDEQGQLSFTVPTVSTVRVLVPLLGYDRLIEASRPEVRVRVLPPTLPVAIP